ncbi:hypothetical protein KP509_22G071600 [Ceratopteris richardii]|uniref:Cytochrome b561 and DOMON domain-containing protein n=1 Tax=Ceratopteris richardii TaxID=49495 RepID=A0A8T2S8Y9_CERRI|nr:hypothetical protein KP509_22G071600 [Ceratopteris richardii]
MLRCFFPEVALLCLLPALLAASAVVAQNTASSAGCSKATTFNATNKLFASCSDLRVQGASLAWTLNENNRTLDVLFSGEAPKAGGWVGWGINPGPAPAMAGTQAFIAFAASNGSTILTYNVTQASMAGGLNCTPISLHVLDMRVQIVGTSIAMLVSLQLQPNQSSVLNLVWNRGSSVSNFQPGAHSLAAADLSGLLTLDMASGDGTVSAASAHQLLKNRHGVLNTVGWGVVLPCGVLVARYLRFADPLWFYAHVFLQLSGFTLGTAGWATGLGLGNSSPGIVYHKHRSIGIALFAISVIQVFALLLRPQRDHKIRKLWNTYHYILGTGILALGILNIFYGFDILSPPKKWRLAYIYVMIAFAGLTLCLEIATWGTYVFKSRSSEKKPQGTHIGVHSRNDHI